MRIERPGYKRSQNQFLNHFRYMPKQPQKRGYMTIDALGSPAANSNSVIRADSSRASNPIKSKSTSEGVSSIRSEMSSVRSVGVRAQSCWSRFCAGIKSVLDAIYSCLARLPLIGSCFIKSSAPVEKTVPASERESSKIVQHSQPLQNRPVEPFLGFTPPSVSPTLLSTPPLLQKTEVLQSPPSLVSVSVPIAPPVAVSAAPFSDLDMASAENLNAVQHHSMQVGDVLNKEHVLEVIGCGLVAALSLKASSETFEAVSNPEDRDGAIDVCTESKKEGDFDSKDYVNLTSPPAVAEVTPSVTCLPKKDSMVPKFSRIKDLIRDGDYAEAVKVFNTMLSDARGVSNYLRKTAFENIFAALIKDGNRQKAIEVAQNISDIQMRGEILERIMSHLKSNL